MLFLIELDWIFIKKKKGYEFWIAYLIVFDLTFVKGSYRENWIEILDRLSIQIYGQKTDFKVLNIFSIETYQIFPAMLFLIELDWIFILKKWIRILDSMFDSI